MTVEEAERCIYDDPDLTGSHHYAVSVLIKDAEEKAVAADRERIAGWVERLRGLPPLAREAMARQIREGGAA